MRIGGWIFVAASLVLAMAAALRMRAAGTHIDPFKPSTALVTGGPFAWTRNPLYLSLTLLYVGAALLFER